MTDINLLHDRGLGEEKKEAEEKERQKSRVVVELTNPNKEHVAESTEKPGTGFWAFLKDLFLGLRRPKPEVPGSGRILHEERHAPQEPPKAPIKPKKKIEEKYAKTTAPEKELEDVFAPVAKSDAEQTVPPTASSGEQRTAQTPKIPDDTFGGVVNVPPNIPPKRAPQDQKTAKPSPRSELSKPTETNPEASSDDISTFLGVNLVPEEMMSSVSKQSRFVALGFIAIISAIIVGLVYVGLSIYQSNIVTQTQTKQQEIADLDRQILQLNAKKRSATAFHSVLQQALTLLDTHIYWTKFFGGLEKYTVQTVAIRSVSADQAGHMTLTLAANSYRSLAQQLIAFEAADDFVQTVTISTGTAAAGKEGLADTVEFSATINLVPGVFYRDSTGGPLFIREE